SGAHRQVGCARHRSPGARGSVRARGAEAQRRNLALRQERRRRSSVRLRLPRSRPGQLCHRRAGRGRRRRPSRSFFAGRGRRDLLHAALRQWRQRATVRELERRELSQDVDQDIGLGHQWTPQRRPAGMPDLPARASRRTPRRRQRMDDPLHDRVDRGGLVLPAGRGVLGTDRLFRPEHQDGSARRREHLSLRTGGRPGGLDDRGADRERFAAAWPAHAQGRVGANVQVVAGAHQGSPKFMEKSLPEPVALSHRMAKRTDPGPFTLIHPIQYLRGIAALMVVWHHGVGQLATLETYFPFRFGTSGVDLFFVISGFIMVVTTAGRDVTPTEFIARRFVRVVPLYWVLTLALAATALVAPSLFRSVTLTAVSLIQSLLFIPHFSPSHAGMIWPVLVPGWTLNYEMFFYVVF